MFDWDCAIFETMLAFMFLSVALPLWHCVRCFVIIYCFRLSSLLAMYSPGSVGMSRTSAAPPVVPPMDDHALPRSPVFSRTSTSAGNYAVVLFVVEVSVLFVTYMFLLRGVWTLCAGAVLACPCFYLFVDTHLVVTVI